MLAFNYLTISLKYKFVGISNTCYDTLHWCRGKCAAFWIPISLRGFITTILMIGCKLTMKNFVINKVQPNFNQIATIKFKLRNKITQILAISIGLLDFPGAWVRMFFFYTSRIFQKWAMCKKKRKHNFYRLPCNWPATCKVYRRIHSNL